MSNTQFVVHKDVLSENDKGYLTGGNTEIKGGFVSGTPALSAAVNAILHETSLIVTALANNVNDNPENQLTPDITTENINTVQSALTTYFESINVNKAKDASHADEADRADEANHANEADEADEAKHAKLTEGIEYLTSNPSSGQDPSVNGYKIVVLDRFPQSSFKQGYIYFIK